MRLFCIDEGSFGWEDGRGKTRFFSLFTCDRGLKLELALMFNSVIFEDFKSNVTSYSD